MLFYVVNFETSKTGKSESTLLAKITPLTPSEPGQNMIHIPPKSINTYLVAACSVVEFAEGSRVAIGHVCTTAEEQ